MQAAPPPIRDIHGAPMPPWWPPAWGWWVVGLLLVVAMVAGLVMMLRRWRKRRRVELLSREIDEIYRRYRSDQNGAAAAASISIYLRRLLLHESGNATAVTVSGEDWVRCLTEPEDLEPQLATAARALAHAPYQAHADINIDNLVALCRFWVRRVAHV